MKFSPLSWLGLFRDLSPHERITMWAREQLQMQRQVHDLTERVEELEQAVAKAFTRSEPPASARDGGETAPGGSGKWQEASEVGAGVLGAPGSLAERAAQVALHRLCRCGHAVYSHDVTGRCARSGCECTFVGRPA